MKSTLVSSFKCCDEVEALRSAVEMLGTKLETHVGGHSDAAP